MVTAHCKNCGEVDLEVIQREVKTIWKTPDYGVQTITVTCTRCSQSTSKDYPLTKAQASVIYGVSPEPVKKKRSRRVDD